MFTVTLATGLELTRQGHNGSADIMNNMMVNHDTKRCTSETERVESSYNPWT